MNRIVSLLPSCTEIICALVCGERPVGRSHECDYPPGVGDLPDGNQFFNRPGPRLVESAETLAEIMYPRDFEGTHEHRGWERWDGRR